MARGSRVCGLLSVMGLVASVTEPRRGMLVNSPLFNEISGKLGGAVGLTSRFGMQLRGLVQGSNPDTPFQFAARASLASLSSIWKNTLTNAQRESWESLSDDTPGSATGIALFIRGNTTLRAGGLAYAASAPESATCELLPPTSIVLDASANTCAFTVPGSQEWIENGCMAVYVSRNQSPTRTTRINPFQLWGTVDAAGAATVNKPALARSLIAGKVSYVRFVAATADGKYSVVYQTRVTIQA